MDCKSENFAGSFLKAKFSGKQPILQLGISNHELHVISSEIMIRKRSWNFAQVWTNFKTFENYINTEVASVVVYYRCTYKLDNNFWTRK